MVAALLLDTPNHTVTKWFEIIGTGKHGVSVGHVKEFSLKELRDMLKTCGFTICSERGVYAPLSLFLPIPVLLDISMALGSRLTYFSYLIFFLVKKN